MPFLTACSCMLYTQQEGTRLQSSGTHHGSRDRSLFPSKASPSQDNVPGVGRAIVLPLSCFRGAVPYLAPIHVEAEGRQDKAVTRAGRLTKPQQQLLIVTDGCTDKRAGGSKGSYLACRRPGLRICPTASPSLEALQAQHRIFPCQFSFTQSEPQDRQRECQQPCLVDPQDVSPP